MKKTILTAALALSAAIGASAQAPAPTHETRVVATPHERGLGVNQTDYAAQTTGFFCAAELGGGYSLTSKRSNLGFSELDFSCGYRVDDFFRVGIGLGARLYFDGDHHRAMSHNWGMPLFVHARGNFIANDYRSVVPFWSVDLGTTFPDGFMLRPSVGIRVGQPRSAFVVSLGYMGQQIRCHKIESNKLKVYHPYTSFITLKMGYEF